MIYVFYHNDPLAQDLGGGAEHFRCLHRALTASELPFRLVAARLQDDGQRGRDRLHLARLRLPAFLSGALGLVLAPPRRRSRTRTCSTSTATTPLGPSWCWRRGAGRVLVSYHNVTGRVLEGWLGRLAAPLRRVMLAFERRVAALADAIICVSGRDRRELARVVAAEPFSRAHVVPAAYDEALFEAVERGAARPGAGAGGC